jgi:type II secretory pathway component PulJ
MQQDFVARAVARLREDPAFSRNRHFHALSSPEGRRALRIHRHLRSLERDLSAAGARASVEREPARVRLTIEGRRGRRVAWLTRAEFRLLCASEAARAALGGAAGAP